MTVYRFRDLNMAEAFLLSLDQVYKRVRRAILDLFSSILFFYKEISMFFKYYIKIREKSIFGCINQYFGVIEINEQGAFHLYGLLWLQRNIYLSFLLIDIWRKEQIVYWDKVIEYIDSVFIKVGQVIITSWFREILRIG